MDQNDQALVDKLKGELAKQGMKTAFAEDAPAAGEKNEDSEVDFLSAMNAFRKAKASGDKDAIAAAERHLQEVVRQEMRDFEGCDTK